MAIRGLKEANDLDLVVTQKLYDEMKTKYTELKPGQIFINDVIEICSPEYSLVNDGDDVINRAEIIKGFPFMTLNDLLIWKKKMGREKDLKDIKIIKKYLEKTGD